MVYGAEPQGTLSGMAIQQERQEEMRIPCTTCNGIGTIPKPLPPGTVMGYLGPNGETWPREFCQTCSGVGWIETETEQERFWRLLHTPMDAPIRYREMQEKYKQEQADEELKRILPEIIRAVKEQLEK